MGKIELSMFIRMIQDREGRMDRAGPQRRGMEDTG